MNTNLKKGVVQEKRALGLTCLFIGTLLGAAPPMLGGMLQSGFSVAGVALVILIGYGIVCVYMGFIAMQASDTGLSIHDTAGAAMGTVAAQLLASLPIAVASIGWFGIQAAMLGAGFSAGWQGITGMTIPPAFGAIVWGGLTALIVMQGYKWLTYFAYAAVPLCILIVAYVLYRLGGQGGLSAILAYRPAQPAPLLSGISVAVSSYALMGVMAGDYFRHTSSRMGAAKGMSGILPTGCIMFCLGAAGVVATGQSDVSALFSQWGHPVMGLFLLVASTISINIMNGYSGGLGVVKMLGLDERQFKLAAGVACGVGVIMGASGILSLFSSFLSLVSSLIPPLAGVVIGSYWLSSMGGGGGVSSLPADIRLPGVIAYIMGASVTYITSSIAPFFIPAINGLGVSLFSYWFLSRVMSPETANRNLSLGAKLTGGFIACAIITIAAGGLGLHGLASLVTAENAARSKEIATMTLIVMVSGVAISIGLGLMFTGLVVKPMRNAFELLKAIAKGDLTQTITRADSVSNDEIGQMMTLLNETQRSISSLIAAVDGKALSLNEVGVELSAMMSQSASSVRQISVNTQHMKDKTLTQAAGVNQTNAVMKQIVQNIQSINQRIEVQLTSVSHSAAAIEQMTAHINSITESLLQNEQNAQDLALASERGKVSLQAVSHDMQEMSQESANLWQINAVIRNIASQTNFLSMNAAIEAAHAGNAGLGFAVVAGEIHRLAESSAEQVAIISHILKRITCSIERVHGTTGQVIVNFEDIDRRVNMVVHQEQQIMETMKQQDAGCKEMLSMIRDSRDVSQNVRAASEEMLQGSKAAITEGKNLEALTTDMINEINEIVTGMNQIDTAVARVSEIALENKESIAVLVQSLSRFKYTR